MTALTLRRITENDKGTFGQLILDDKTLCWTCERNWKDNEPDVSCIPGGSYVFAKYESPTKGHVFITDDVVGRKYIEIHSANWPYQLEGCIAVGEAFIRDPGSFKPLGVSASRLTMQHLYESLPDTFTLVVEPVASASA